VKSLLGSCWLRAAKKLEENISEGEIEIKRITVNNE